MKQRKFPRALYHRVLTYYHLQWTSHEGAVIPSKQSVIWDAPQHIIRDLSKAHALNLIARIPLFKVFSYKKLQ